MRELFDKDELWDKAMSVGSEPMVYLHWTAGWYGQGFEDYHICIDADGSYELMTDSLADTLAHTWGRNTGSIGIALECCVGAKVVDVAGEHFTRLGDNPPTDSQIETMCQICAKICEKLAIPIENVMTHAEAAEEDGYGIDSDDPDCRWDLAVLHEDDAWGTGGNEIRRRIHEIMGRDKSLLHE